jgi:hypothetical protein
MQTLNTLLIVLTSFLTIAGTISTLYAFQRGKKVETVRIQNEVIIALQQQVDVIKEDLNSLRTENTRLKTIIETIQLAFKKQGISITIDGEIVIISEHNNRTTQKRATKLVSSTVKKTVTTTPATE